MSRTGRGMRPRNVKQGLVLGTPMGLKACMEIVRKQMGERIGMMQSAGPSLALVVVNVNTISNLLPVYCHGTQRKGLEW